MEAVRRAHIIEGVLSSVSEVGRWPRWYEKGAVGVGDFDEGREGEREKERREEERQGRQGTALVGRKLTDQERL